MAKERGMTGAEVREVFGDREVLELEHISSQLTETIESIKANLREKWDADLQDELRNSIGQLREVEARLRELDEKFTRINNEARPVN